MGEDRRPEWEPYGITVDSRTSGQVTFTFGQIISHPTLGYLGRQLGATRSGGTSHSLPHNDETSTTATFFLSDGVALSETKIMEALRASGLLH